MLSRIVLTSNESFPQCFQCRFRQSKKVFWNFPSMLPRIISISDLMNSFCRTAQRQKEVAWNRKNLKITESFLEFYPQWFWNFSLYGFDPKGICSKVILIVKVFWNFTQNIFKDKRNDSRILPRNGFDSREKYFQMLPEQVLMTERSVLEFYPECF